MSIEVNQPTRDFSLPNLDARSALPAKSSLYGRACRASTIESRCRAVERVILAMYERLDEPLSLQAMAKIAFISPYHFNRIFHQIVGMPPSQFLYALRLAAAKRLLLTTQHSVTDVCYDVGYNSLGSFITRFTQLVGLSPRHLRRLSKDRALSDLKSLCDNYKAPLRVMPSRADLTGQIRAPDSFAGLIFVGLFPKPIPQSQPVGCALLTAPGSYRIAPVPDGRYYVLAAALAWSKEPLAYLLNDSALRGAAGPLLVRDGQVSGPADVLLRPAQLADPPILMALPWLLAKPTAIDGVMSAATTARKDAFPALAEAK